MNTLKKLLVVAMIASMVLGCFVFSTSAVKPQEYVTDGLVAWYDATNNSNGDHLTSATVWKDLSGNGYHIDLSQLMADGKVSWTNNALYINQDTSANIMLPSGITEIMKNTEAYTIEIVLGDDLDYKATAYITIFCSNCDELAIFIRCANDDTYDQAKRFPNEQGTKYSDLPRLDYKNADSNGDSNRPMVKDGFNAIKGKTLTVTSDLAAFDGARDWEDNPTNGNVNIYTSGTVIASGESEYKLPLTQDLQLGNEEDRRVWGGSVHALRIYDRALTADEVADNAAADEYNYRKGNSIEPVKQYDDSEEGDIVFEDALKDYKDPAKLILNGTTNMIPTEGFYSAKNISNYMYPYESDIEAGTAWEGAKIALSETPTTDAAGNAESGVSFKVMYEQFCKRAGIEMLAGDKTQYIVIKMIVNGQFEDFNMTAYAVSQADSNTTMEYPTTSDNGVDLEKQGEVQYLIYDVADLFTGDLVLYRLYFDVMGLTEGSSVIMQEICIFDNQDAAYDYAGVVIETEPEETEPEVVETEATDTEAQDTEAQGTEAQGTEAQGTDATEDEGCGSVVGFGAAAILAAAAAAVVLKKKD